MRWLLGLFFVIAIRASAAPCAAGTVAYWPFDNNANDPCGGYTLTVNGSPSYTTTGICGTGSTYAATNFSGANYFSGPAGLLTAFTGYASAYSVEAWVYITSGIGPQVIVRINVDGTAAGTFELAVVGASPRTAYTRTWSGGAWQTNATLLAVPDNTCVNLAGTFNGTTQRIYVNGVDSGNAAGTSWSGRNVNLIFVGSDTSTFVSGNIDGVRLSNIVRTSFPTVDPSANTNRSLYLDQQLFPDFSTRLGRRMIWAFFWPKHAYAHTQDQRIEQTVNVQNYIAWETRTGRITKTATPGPTNTRVPFRSHTASATVTPTPDPAKLTPTRTPSRP